MDFDLLASNSNSVMGQLIRALERLTVLQHHSNSQPFMGGQGQAVHLKFKDVAAGNGWAKRMGLLHL